MPILKYLDLSTGHLHESELPMLASDRTRGLTVIETDYGFNVYTTDKFIEKGCEQNLINSGYSQEFINIVKYAIKKDCTYINFDSDAENMEEFPVFDW